MLSFIPYHSLKSLIYYLKSTAQYAQLIILSFTIILSIIKKINNFIVYHASKSIVCEYVISFIVDYRINFYQDSLVAVTTLLSEECNFHA